MSGPIDADAASAIERIRGGADVWLAATDAVRDAEAARRCGELLTGDERAACDAFHHEADRRRALVARALVRTTLSRYAAVAPQAWRFAAGTEGRPEIADPAGTRLRFNLSHTRELVACAVTLDDDVGVDVERTAPHADLLALAETVFTAREAAELRDLEESLRPDGFCARWTLKEAYLKARGLGLALDPRTLDVDLDAAGRVSVRFAPDAHDDPSAWWFAVWHADAGHLLALALRRQTAPARVGLFRVAPPEDRFARIDLPRVAASSAAQD